VIAVDTNLLVYAHRRESRDHDAARELLRTLAEGRKRWAIPWPCVYEFFSVVTNARIWKEDVSTPEVAWAQLDAWFGSPTLTCLAEPPGFAALLADFVRRPRVRGAVVHDARVAALCVAHGVEVLLTRDRDFALFPELATRDPLRTA
jgi:toxin-antitoxin system PIN domain toxin